MSTLELDHALNTLIIQGRSIEAFQKFYAEDVVAQENDEPERIGRDAWMRARQEMEKNINGDTSFSEWEYNVELEGIGAMQIAQVAVRRWKDSKVVRERFYHK